MLESEIEILAKLASECFVDDEFYKSLEKDQKKTEKRLLRIFLSKVFVFVIYMVRLMFINLMINLLDLL